MLSSLGTRGGKGDDGFGGSKVKRLSREETPMIPGREFRNVETSG
jgi:hypothetical protein